jgi:hypothetical protein
MTSFDPAAVIAAVREALSNAAPETMKEAA